MYIIFDLDDTILNYNRDVDDFTLCTLRYFQNKGHKLVINTARSLKNTMTLIEKIKPDFSILYGGSLIVDHDLNALFKSVIDNQVLNCVIQDLVDNVSGMSVETIDTLYTNDKDYHGEYFDFKNQKFNDEVYKLLFCTTNYPLRDKLGLKYNLNIETYRNLIWHRYVNKDVSKALGVRHLLKINGGTFNDCIAFGDDYGDVEMLNICKYGAIMKNASEDVKKKVKCKECENNNDYGVARFLLNLERENVL